MINIEEPENLKHYAIVLDGTVVNTVVWDGISEYNPGDEYTLVDLTGVDPEPGIDWDYDGENFIDNRPVPEMMTTDGA